MVDGDPEPSGVEAVAAARDRVGQQRPRRARWRGLEVVAEGEVAGHLEEGVVPGGDADLVDIGGADAFLDAGGRGVRRGALTQEVGHELDHARVDEQQVRVVEDHRRTGHLGVSGIDEVIQEPLPDLMGLHGSGCPSCVGAARRRGRPEYRRVDRLTLPGLPPHEAQPDRPPRVVPVEVDQHHALQVPAGALRRQPEPSPRATPDRVALVGAVSGGTVGVAVAVVSAATAAPEPRPGRHRRPPRSR